MSEQQYGILREQGEFNDFKPVNEKENKQLQEAAERENANNRDRK